MFLNQFLTKRQLPSFACNLVHNSVAPSRVLSVMRRARRVSVGQSEASMISDTQSELTGSDDDGPRARIENLPLIVRRRSRSSDAA
jgi:hypothetical protein